MNSFQKIINDIKSKIPEQGPLEYFVHHNTIHHYENLNFFDAVKKAAVDFNANAFMPEEFYIHKYNLRIIKQAELVKVIQGFISKYHLDLPHEIILKLLLDQTDEPTNDQHLKIQEAQEQYYITKPYFFSQAMREDFGIEIDFYALPTIYRFLSAYFDYGSAYWLLEDREIGMWRNFCLLHNTKNIFDNKYRRTLSLFAKEFTRENSIFVIQSILNRLDIQGENIEGYLFEICVKNKGWAGFIKSLEEHPEWIKCHDIIPSFTDFVAIALTCEYASILSFSKNFSSVPKCKKLPLHSTEFLGRFFIKIMKYSHIQNQLFNALPFFTDFNRQEILHRAYEQSFYNMFLAAYTNHPVELNHSYIYQVICCIDEREESFRRYLEMDSGCETFGCAGHFGLNILYKGFFDKHYRALCPVNMNPEFKITEGPENIKFLRYRMLLVWGELQWLATMSSKTIVMGYFQSFISGVLSIIPFILDIIDPRIMFHLKDKISKHLKMSVATQLFYKKDKDNDLGISFESRLNLAESFLKMVSLVKDFSPYIFIVGHGSSSLNNPHEAAHDCGACGGGRGSPNARLMALILNEQAIREQLKNNNIVIPPDTRFVGVYHNTCSDEIEFFDVDINSISESFKRCVEQLKKAAAFDAQERCRRFSNLPIGNDPDYYLNYVQSRSVDLRQPRPEYGHATNAICLIGPRSYTRNLFLDRRAFLVSYSPEQDTDAVNLKKLLSAVIPVCAGINLEYYFSFVDNEIYGCGTKLPHNVNALIGVINGHMSDLRLGLPWQMVEIHQPIRLLVTIVSQIKLVEELLCQDNAFTTLIQNEWINIAVHDPKTHKIWLYKNKKFEEYKSTKFSPHYFQYDRKILSTRHHMEFGQISHG